MAVINGARRGAWRRGRYATRSTVKPNVMHTGTAADKPMSTVTVPGKPLAANSLMTDSAVRAPIITTSPWAKLIRPRMP